MLRSDIRGAHLRASAPDHEFGRRRRQQVRELLAALAEIDHAYEIDLETVRTSDVSLAIKHSVTDALRKRHQEHRAPYLRELHQFARGAESAP